MTYTLYHVPLLTCTLYIQHMHHVVQCMYMYMLPFQVLQLEARLLRSEQERDKVVESAFHARAQSQTKITQLRTNIQVICTVWKLSIMDMYNHVHEVCTCTCTMSCIFV